MKTTINTIIQQLENFAPLNLQEPYDNAGLLIGNANNLCKGVLICLDVTMDVVAEAKTKKCNLIIAHHPLIFLGLKNINYHSQQGQIIIETIKNDIAIYTIHTNLDNVLNGVNGSLAKLLGLSDVKILKHKENTLEKLFFYVPPKSLDAVRDAVFNIGAGNIGNYSECSFNVIGTGTFKPNIKANPFVGQIDRRHYEDEIKVEIIYPAYLAKKVETALIKAHPYEEVAYDLIALQNKNNNVGSGAIGKLLQPLTPILFLKKIKKILNLTTLKHTALIKNKITTVALCGGSGSFLIPNAIKQNADIFITSDLKYHDYFQAEDKIILVDIGHYESEVHTINLIFDLLKENTESNILHKTTINTNPVGYM